MLGVDPGTRVVGYGLIDARAGGTRFDYVECGTLRVDSALDMPSRLYRIADGLAEIICEFSPREMALEAAFHGVNASSALKLGLARGAIMVVGAQHGLRIDEYAPAHVKKAVVGHGRATKAEIQARVRLLCHLQRPPSADAADALALAICHGHAVTPLRAAAAAGAARRGTRKRG
ncbi:MAG: crossover junction endodeoxyribonuclease RuvC [Myxococcales bacterium]|nr:crossover junction endodeoxyribonuclease RuvC [Myxococcales bacterium]